MIRSKFALLIFIFGTALLLSCGGRDFKKSPLDAMIRDLPTDEAYSIILHDMDVQGNFFETFYHQYQVIREEKSGEVTDYTTGWLEVSEEEFNRHINDMGMEIAARDSTGKLTKAAMPPGYSNFVGNQRYGHWTTDSHGSSFWAFYGQYAFMSSLFNTMTYPARRDHYRDWRANYYGRRDYYGPVSGGRSYYGTNSKYTRGSNPTSTWSRNRSSFKERVSSRTSRSTGSSGSLRSRGGSFGK